MANKKLFGSIPGTHGAPAVNTTNEAGGVAYKFTPHHALAQIAATNTFNGTFYATSEDTLKLAREAVNELKHDPEFIAKTAIYIRDKGYMKDMPAYLVAVLAAIPSKDRSLFRKTFKKVIDNGKMLRNFVQIGRSGAAGKKLNISNKSIRTAIQEWFDSRSAETIYRASVGNDPTLQDILKIARIRTESGSDKSALLAHLLGKPFNKETQSYEYRRRNPKGEMELIHSDPYVNLPEVVRAYEAYKKNPQGSPPNVDFQLLTALPLGPDQWKEVARNAPWHMTRINLQTFARNGVFGDKEMVKLIADRLRDPEVIKKVRVFPYQLFVAYKMVSGEMSSGWRVSNETPEVPMEIVEALQDAMEVATENTPEFPGDLYVGIDVSGSMSSPVTGNRGQVTSRVNCVDVAALFGSTILRKNKLAEVWPFDTKLHGNGHVLNPRDSVMTNASKLAKYGGGGTNCSLLLNSLNNRKVRDANAVIYVSDNESWVDTGYSSTGMMKEWKEFEIRNPKAKLICIDLTPRKNSQVNEQKNILQVGGFSDSVFEVVSSYIKDGNDSDHWVRLINAIEI